MIRLTILSFCILIFPISIYASNEQYIKTLEQYIGKNVATTLTLIGPPDTIYPVDKKTHLVKYRWNRLSPRDSLFPFNTGRQFCITTIEINPKNNIIQNVTAEGTFCYL